MGLAFLNRWLGRSAKPVVDSNGQQDSVQPQDSESQFNLGQRLADGEGSVRNYAEAARWFLKSAEQGHRAAQFNLGLMYGQGQGVLRNQVAAHMWLRKAATLGHAGAQYRVGVGEHRASRSARQSEASECRIEAFKWLQLACAQGYQSAESAQAFVALGMTREEVKQGKSRALAFTAGRPESEAVVE